MRGTLELTLLDICGLCLVRACVWIFHSLGFYNVTGKKTFVLWHVPVLVSLCFTTRAPRIQRKRRNISTKTEMYVDACKCTDGVPEISFSPVFFICRGMYMTMTTVFYPAGSVAVWICILEHVHMTWQQCVSDVSRAPDSVTRADFLTSPGSTWRCVDLLTSTLCEPDD